VECGWASVRWVGRCGGCQEWGSVAEAFAPAGGASAAVAPAVPAVPIGEIDPAAAGRTPTGVGELDRVLGGGFVPGAVVLLAGEPGVGKSTLLLDVAARWARRSGPALYVSGEESIGQIRLRADRIGASSPSLFVAAEADVGAILGHIDQVRPRLVIVDSVQTITVPGAEGAAGGVAQVRAVAACLAQAAKARGLPLVLVGHVTKDGSVAGPRTLEHIVDVVVSFEGDRQSGFRMIRAAKNRFGPADEVGCFELTEGGIREVPDPSGVFMSRCGEPVPGTAMAVALEGRRPLLAEIQALVAPTAAPNPRRVSHGLDFSRLAMILAVLQRRAGVRLHVLDVYASTVGGARVGDPAADLALAFAVASAVENEICPPGLAAIGEVGLAGELRRAPDVGRRLAEAARLGFREAIVPAGSLEAVSGAASPRGKETSRSGQGAAAAAWPGLTVIEAPTLAHALGLVGLAARSRRGGAGQGWEKERRPEREALDPADDEAAAGRAIETTAFADASNVTELRVRPERRPAGFNRF
jgi:DNA repair protein RadA/Sms